MEGGENDGGKSWGWWLFQTIETALRKAQGTAHLWNSKVISAEDLSEGPQGERDEAWSGSPMGSSNVRTLDFRQRVFGSEQTVVNGGKKKMIKLSFST